MSVRKLIAAGLVALLVSAGVGAATTDVGAQASNQQQSLDGHYDVSASYEDSTVTLTVLTNGSGVEGIDVYVGEERVGTTNANGTVAFERTVEEDLEVTLEGEGLTAELEFERTDGELKLVESEIEAEEAEAEEEDDQGPPSSVPNVAPDKVSEIHELIRQHLNGTLNGSLGEAVSEVAAGDRPGQAGDRDDETVNESAENVERPPMADGDADEEPTEENSDGDDEYVAEKEDDEDMDA